jgi:formamidopyrimidine-DNA glycosylase
MPELPEVETVRQTLRRKIINKTIVGVDILYDKIIKTDLNQFKDLIIGQTITEIDRLGKYLIIRLGNLAIISHLRMEGKYFLRPIGTEREKHDHVIFRFSDQTELRYHDVRKFGTMHLKSFDEIYIGEPLEKLGLEPFHEHFNLAYLKNKLNAKRAIKNVLLDQTIVVGLGNIYVNEVLYVSRIHPETLACVLNEEDLLRIREASIAVLEKAIALGGTTIRSYYSDDDVTGRFQNELLVHGKKGEDCPTCGGVIDKIKVGGRGTYYCPNCQRHLTNGK